MLVHRSSCGASLPARLAVAALLSASLLVARAAQAQTVTVASDVSPGASRSGSYFVGDSFLTAGGGPYNNLVLNLYSDDASTMPYAVGTGYLLSQAYSGDPADLSSLTAGYIDSAAASGNYYTFSSSTVLQASTTYYFYENGVPDAYTEEVHAANYLYYTTSSGSPYNALYGYPVTFTLSGTQAPTPEPASAALLLLPCLPLACGIVRRTVSAKRGAVGFVA